MTVIEAATKAAATIDQQFESSEPQIRAALHASMQKTLSNLGRYEEAIAEGRKALEALHSVQPADTRTQVDVQIEMADDLIELSKPADAAAILNSLASTIADPELAQSELAVRYWSARGRMAAGNYQLPQALEEFERATAIVRSSSKISDAARFCDRFVLLSGGTVRGEGTEEELRTRSGIAGDLEEVFLALT